MKIFWMVIQILPKLYEWIQEIIRIVTTNHGENVTQKKKDQLVREKLLSRVNDAIAREREIYRN